MSDKFSFLVSCLFTVVYVSLEIYKYYYSCGKFFLIFFIKKNQGLAFWGGGLISFIMFKNNRFKSWTRIVLKCLRTVQVYFMNVKLDNFLRTTVIEKFLNCS